MITHTDRHTGDICGGGGVVGGMMFPFFPFLNFTVDAGAILDMNKWMNEWMKTWPNNPEKN